MLNKKCMQIWKLHIFSQVKWRKNYIYICVYTFKKNYFSNNKLDSENKWIGSLEL